ncbi:MAG: HAD family hydrolase [Terriglobia bacterium]|nr:MAG: HAD family hydrolase [Terriglobia bacterium]
MNKPILVFDMDGVLVDVTESYREAIAQTVKHFTSIEISHPQIQDYKNQGGWNDDWRLSHHIINQAGVAASLEEVTAHFQKIFLGNGSDGLMLREQWIARPGTLEKLNEHFRLAVFTGRPKPEAELTLRRFAPQFVFDPIVGMYEVENRKPAPDGLLRIVKDHSDCEAFYVGDTVDDARCAKAARVPFIGIAAPANPRYLDLVFLFQAEAPYAVIDDINYLAEVFAL